MHLTICYLTCRKDPKIEWFYQSLRPQLKGYSGARIKYVIVDFWAEEPGRKEYLAERFHLPFTHTAPKPTVWQGKHRLCKEDYYALANARNTGYVNAPDGYVAFVDDLSIVVDTWLAEVDLVLRGGWIAAGSYAKVKDMQVENGKLVGDPELIQDSRWDRVAGLNPVRCAGKWFYGCTSAIPTSVLDQTNGFDEAVDATGQGCEDVTWGLMAQQWGFTLKYHKRMRIIESVDGHCGTTFPRRMKENVMGYQDSNYAILGLIKAGRKRSPNPLNLHEERKRVLAGAPYTIVQEPKRDWRDRQPVSEL